MLALAASQVLEGVWPSIMDKFVFMPTMAHPKPISLFVASKAEVRILCACLNVL
jgi:hypothetical protein